jgi:beta-glucosidase-like glycosyl hydrolase
MDMGGAGDAGRPETVIAAAGAGMDLLLLAHPPAIEEAAFEAFTRPSGRAGSIRRGSGSPRPGSSPSAGAFDRSGEAPPLEIVGCSDHRALAREIARSSITLVTDPRATLPLRLGAGARVALIAPVPVDLTPAETSSYLQLGLARRLRDRGVAVDELVTPIDPTPAEVAALAGAVQTHEVVLVGTIDAVTFGGQARLVAELEAGAGDRRSCVAVALRSPYDVGPTRPRCGDLHVRDPGPQMEAWPTRSSARSIRGFAAR